MLFPPRTSLSALISWSRALRHQLSAGLPLTRVFQHAAQKGPRQLRPVAGRIAADLGKGDSLEDALERERDHFPPLFRELATIGERTGHLPEMFGELEEYYSLQQSLRRSFYQQITLPVLQFVGGVLVIALLIWILGMIAETRGGEPLAPIGMGLTGAGGALTFLVGVVVILASVYGVYRLMTRTVAHQAAFASLLLRLPAIGPCLEALAMHRFCIALRLTLETGMPIQDALRLTLRATGNTAFAQFGDVMVMQVRRGDEVHTALALCPHFPREFIEVVEVGEVSGQLPEAMIRQAEYYREEAERRMKGLTKAAGMGVWAMVAILMIIAIFKVAGIYLNALGAAAG